MADSRYFCKGNELMARCMPKVFHTWHWHIYIYIYIYIYMCVYVYACTYAYVYVYLSSTWCEFDPNTAYVVCISICPYFLIWYPYAPTSLYGHTTHCSGHGVAMGCYRLCIVPRIAIVTSQWYDRYCFTDYARTWARHPTTPWQRECTAITDCQSIDSL